MERDKPSKPKAGKSKAKAKSRRYERKRGGQARAISELMPEIGRTAFRRFGFVQSSVVTRWPEIVGPTHAKVCAPEAIRFPPGEKNDGILQLVVVPAHAPLIQHVLPEIIERVNRFFGYNAVSRAKIRKARLRRRLQGRKSRHRRRLSNRFLSNWANPCAISATRNCAPCWNRWRAAWATKTGRRTNAMKLTRIAVLVTIAALSVAAGKANWTATVNVTEAGGHVLGNPGAPAKLTEYVSYTCDHCAAFQRESNAPLRIAYVQPGKVSVKVQHLLRDPIDLTVAMLTNCGNPKGFFKRHHTFLYNQDKWMAKLPAITRERRQHWSHGEMRNRLRAVARDFGFYEMMKRQGYSRTRVDACLGDTAMAQRLVAQTEAARKLGVKGTPSFAINGTLLTGTHSWTALQPKLKAVLD